MATDAEENLPEERGAEEKPNSVHSLGRIKITNTLLQWQPVVILTNQITTSLSNSPAIQADLVSPADDLSLSEVFSRNEVQDKLKCLRDNMVPASDRICISRGNVHGGFRLNAKNLMIPGASGLFC
ncbi:hypothetical protein Q9966_007776 [Columba livia]|nr:hypothetical protein Q9966_007776 [Columba livia]